ncbi:M23 family metallopeptidase [Streptomyces sp. WAC 00631]|uniref:M23 family metallopeptidase n=1 Tax=unclassified Streptomyces TaxID=2593676 RepID=UPI001E53104F|nr:MULTISPECIES: M23 family metallopeptidase [unclassified Streptomyces]MCC5035780.1 M23 family metallopeptidase [Streptomyces sp. WAC 00631]MCC9739172.1 M23 family metallopeptidase [Streptomyces sp. MNU89]
MAARSTEWRTAAAPGRRARCGPAAACALLAVWLLVSRPPGPGPGTGAASASPSLAAAEAAREAGGEAGGPATGRPDARPRPDDGGTGRRAGPRTARDLTRGPRAWPVGGTDGAGRRPRVLRAWQPPPSRYAAGHRGVDLASRAGRTVRAAAPGRVSFAGVVAGRGVVSVELDGTGEPPLRITYQPVTAEVEKGDRVTAGQPVGVLDRGPFHCRTACLHWGLLRGEEYLDPLSLLPGWILRGAPSRLLPVFGVPEPDA